ncbi:hypothetical protein TKK_0008277 [Trichogramma kaykai]
MTAIMQSQIPLPLGVSKTDEVEDRRLWVVGPQAGQPRGYAFVTYKTYQEAETAMNALQNLKIGSKYIRVRYAHSIKESEMDRPKPQLEVIPALTGAKLEDKKLSRDTAIQAIEAKLKMMEESEEEFNLNKPLTGTPVIQQYQKADNSKPSTSMRHHSRDNYHNRKPYSRGRSRR